MNSSSENKSNSGPSPGLWQQLKDACRVVFGLDVRSLAVFRMALGLIIICDLFFRARTLTEMYTDDGFYSRQISYDYYQSTWGEGWSTIFWSLYWLGGSPAFVTTLFVIAGLFALMLMVGKWTRVATIVSWVFLVSLHVRNPVIISSADFLLKLMLVWSVFLPLGRVWSLDARVAKRKGQQASDQGLTVSSFASAGLVIQLFILYFFTGIAKWNEGWWTGEAMYYCMGLDIYVTSFGQKLLQYPLLLKFISIATVVAEVFFIWTLFIAKHNDRWRLFNMVLFWGFHIGIAMSMSIGMFPYICMIAWIPLLPGYVWRGLPQPEATRVIESATRKPSFGFQVQQVFCAVLIVFVIGWNIGNIEHETIQKYTSPVFYKIGCVTRLNQHFQMFGQPPKSNPRFVYEAVLEDGRQIDLLTGSEFEAENVKSMQEVLPSFHWRKLHRNLVSPTRESLRKPLAEYWVRKWNDQHPDNKVARLRLMYHEEDTSSEAVETQNQYSKVWVSLQDKESGAGSLFDQVKQDESSNPLNLGF